MLHRVVGNKAVFQSVRPLVGSAKQPCLQVVDKVLAEVPTNLQVLNLLEMLLKRLDRPADATKALMAASAAQPKNLDLLNAIFDLHIRWGPGQQSYTVLQLVCHAGKNKNGTASKIITAKHQVGQECRLKESLRAGHGQQQTLQVTLSACCSASFYTCVLCFAQHASS